MGLHEQMYVVDWSQSKGLITASPMWAASTEMYGLGKRYQGDLIFETRIHGEEGQVLFRVEPQSYHDPEFARRMLVYTAVVSRAKGQRVLPIGVTTYKRVKADPTTVDMVFPFLTVLRYEHLQLGLKKQNWRTYAETDNPAVAALLSQMSYLESERVVR